MDWRNVSRGILAASLLLASAGAANLDYFDLSSYPRYCEDHSIQDYCTGEAFTELVDDMLRGELPSVFVNELAYSDEVVYSGPLEISELSVEIRLDPPLASVEAIYRVKNTGPDVDVILMAKRVPANIRAYEDGSEVGIDETLHAWNSRFSAGQEKEITFIFLEGFRERIYGYNANLVIDNKIPAGKVTPTGRFGLLLPENTIPGRCEPEESSIEIINGRVKVVWERTDFVPWTNPFNDLICTWGEALEGMIPEDTVVEPKPIEPSETPETPGESAGVEAQGDGSWIYWVLALVIILALVYYYRMYFYSLIDRMRDRIGY